MGGVARSRAQHGDDPLEDPRRRDPPSTRSFARSRSFRLPVRDGVLAMLPRFVDPAEGKIALAVLEPFAQVVKAFRVATEFDHLSRGFPRRSAPPSSTSSRSPAGWSRAAWPPPSPARSPRWGRGAR